MENISKSQMRVFTLTTIVFILGLMHGFYAFSQTQPREPVKQTHWYRPELAAEIAAGTLDPLIFSRGMPTHLTQDTNNTLTMYWFHESLLCQTKPAEPGKMLVTCGTSDPKIVQWEILKNGELQTTVLDDFVEVPPPPRLMRLPDPWRVIEGRLKEAHIGQMLAPMVGLWVNLAGKGFRVDENGIVYDVGLGLVQPRLILCHAVTSGIDQGSAWTKERTLCLRDHDGPENIGYAWVKNISGWQAGLWPAELMVITEPLLLIRDAEPLLSR